jgi:hypothetical protein
MTPETDPEWGDYLIDNVTIEEPYFIITIDGRQLGIPLGSPVVPQSGDIARLWGHGHGYTVRGVAINGTVVFYNTPDESARKIGGRVIDTTTGYRVYTHAGKRGVAFAISAIPRVAGHQYPPYVHFTIEPEQWQDIFGQEVPNAQIPGFHVP